MSPITDLDTLLRSMEPRVVPGEFVFVAVPDDLPGLGCRATVVEDEGLSAVVERSEADQHGLDYDFVAAWISLTVHSALDAVGLTAAVSRALADVDISCNVIAGRNHDHLLVPVDRTDDALAALAALSSRPASS